MATSMLLRFDRPLRGARITGRHALVTTSDLELARTESYRAGQDAARQFADQQLVEMRTDVQELQHGLFTRLAQIEPDLVAQVRDALPELVMEVARRLLTGYEPPVEQINRICQETLEQLYPETTGLELRLCPRDAEILETFSPDWLRRYPGMTVTRDTHLRPGDCVIHSRFGVTDARLDAKLESVAHELGAAR